MLHQMKMKLKGMKIFDGVDDEQCASSQVAGKKNLFRLPSRNSQLLKVKFFIDSLIYAMLSEIEPSELRAEA